MKPSMAKMFYGGGGEGGREGGIRVEVRVRVGVRDACSTKWLFSGANGCEQ